ncbi:MAG TPA: cell division protein ZapB [Bryobacteraceae bacterium]|jgi:FtsZ-binding cell division protein ZapB|nr:cell division protein ZapB [Bryobacteraceae bacterium]
MTPIEQEADALSSLEDRIQRAIEMVSRLRAEKEAALEEAAEAKAEVERLTEDNRLLQSERKQVRSRIEKLLGQIDQLSS